MGDSNTASVVARGKKMPDLVEQRLREIYQPKGIGVEVVNAGTSSYATGQYYLLIKNRILDFMPDLVVINVDMSDIPDDYFYGRMTKFDDKGLPIAILPNIEETSRYQLTPFGTIERSWTDRVRATMSHHSSAFRFLERIVAGFNHPVDLMEFRHWVIDDSANWLSLEWTPAIENRVNHSMAMLRAAADILSSHSIKTLVVSVPDHGQFNGQNSTRPHEAIAATAKAAGVASLNGLEAIKTQVNETPQDRFFWNNDPMHFNEEGNAIWAEAQINALLDPASALLPAVQ